MAASQENSQTKSEIKYLKMMIESFHNNINKIESFSDQIVQLFTKLDSFDSILKELNKLDVDKVSKRVNHLHQDLSRKMNEFAVKKDSIQDTRRNTRTESLNVTSRLHTEDEQMESRMRHIEGLLNNNFS